jgi:hypothetical protein
MPYTNVMGVRMRRSGLAVLFVLVVAAGCTSIPKDWKVAVIVLHHGPTPAPEASPSVVPPGEPTPPCQLAFKSPTIEAKQGQTIAWAVLNTCGRFDLEVKVLGFTRLEGTAEKSVTHVPATTKATVPPLEKDSFGRLSDGRLGIIRARVRPDATVGTYSYHLQINGQEVDPVIVIRMFP